MKQTGYRQLKKMRLHFMGIGGQGISAVAQNFALGLAETRDFSDALVAFFGMRTRYLQAVDDRDIAMSSLARATGVADFRSL